MALASECRGTTLAVELYKRARPLLQSSFMLDLSWGAIDRDLWPLGSWNKALGESGPRQRRGQGPAVPGYLADQRLL